MLAADLVWPLRAAQSGAFTLEDEAAAPEAAVVTAVARPVLQGLAAMSEVQLKELAAHPMVGRCVLEAALEKQSSQA